MELTVNERIGNNINIMKQVKLNDVIEFARNGAAIKQSEDAKGFPISRIETIWNSTIDEDRLGYADIYDEDLIKYEKYLLKENDILITHINSPKHLGKSAIYTGYPEKLIHGMNLLCLRNNPNFSNSKYLFYYFQTKYFKNQILKISNQSVNQASFAVTNLKELKIPVPTLPTQQKIAEILDTADQLRQYNKQLIAKYDALTQSLFLDMFGDPVRNEKGWEVTSIRELCSEVKYGTSEKSIENGTFSYLRMNNITYGGYMDFSNLKYIDIPEKDIHKYLVKKGDILFNRTNSKELVGKTGLITTDHEYIIAGYLIRVRTNELANPYYIWAHLNSKWSKMTLNNMCKNIVGMANINAQELQDIQILKAPILLQTQFAERVQMIETQKLQAQEALAKSEDLFQSLLQRAFKGELN
jgi:type I restriction enzyme S subunit